MSDTSDVTVQAPRPGSQREPGEGRPCRSTGYPVPEGYELIERLGEGGMGTVFLARQSGLGRPVALKYLTATAPGVADRFLREGKILSRLRHPNVVEVFGFVLLDEIPLLICEFVEGRDLRSVLAEEGAMRPSRALSLMRGALEGLAYAHGQGVVHRDLKSANLILTSAEHVKLLDFGVASCRDVEGELTRTGVIMGTPAYMAPEQTLGMHVDHRADIYSIGVILFELLAARVPFMDPNPLVVLEMQRKEQAPDLGSEAPGVGGALAGIVARCLAKDPSQRFQTVGELITALQEPAVVRESVARRTTRKTAALGPKPLAETMPGSAAPADRPPRVRVQGGADHPRAGRTTTGPGRPVLPPAAASSRRAWHLVAGAAAAGLAVLALLSTRPDTRHPPHPSVSASASQSSSRAAEQLTTEQVSTRVESLHKALFEGVEKPNDGRVSGPEAELWFTLLIRLARHCGQETPALSSALLESAPRSVTLAAVDRLTAIADQKLRFLEDCAPSLLAKPVSEVPLKHKRILYDCLTVLRVVDRLRVSYDLKPRFHAARWLGRSFCLGTGESSVGRPPSLEGTQRRALYLQAIGMGQTTNRALELGELVAGDNFDQVQKIQARLPLRAAAGRGRSPLTCAHLELDTQITMGHPTTLSPSDLVWVKMTEPVPWLFLLHETEEPPGKSSRIIYTHRLHPALIEAGTTCSLVVERNVLRKRDSARCYLLLHVNAVRLLAW
ncbi:MAG: serine/threonine protein kinase [Candidatus Riflebacteria bacterium]|nr:serine/threonine protein kinase [Candidatus Riflebacteria bacterium]